MKKYQVYAHGVLVSANDTLIERMVHFKNYSKKFGLDNVDLTCKEDDIQTIRIIISKED